MAPNKRGVAPEKLVTEPSPADYPPTGNGPHQGVITKEEVEARGAGTNEKHDSYDTRRRLSSEVRVLFTGLMFLTRLPVPAWVDHHPAYLMRSMQFFPLVGALVGAWGAAWYGAAAVLWPAPPALAATVSTLATVWLTGCFHEDGLSDTFDGFGGGWGRDQILRIMKDSRVGTYALVGTALTLQAKVFVLGLLGPARAPAALIAAHAASRWTCLPLTYRCEYVQDPEDAKRGLYNVFAASRPLLTLPRILLGTASAAAALWLALPFEQAAAAALVVIAVTAASGYYGNLVIGGVVGDYLGATIQVAELAIYLVLAADWAALASNWRPFAQLALAAAVPVIYCRRIIAAGGSNC